MNRLRIYFVEGQPRQGRPVVMDAPRIHGIGELSGLFETAPLAACGCRGTWNLGEYDNGDLEFGWWVSFSHSAACRRANA